MSVLKAFRREPIIMRFMTRKMMVPRRMVKVDDEGFARTGLVLTERPKGEWYRRTPYDRIEGGIERVEKYCEDIYKVRTLLGPEKRCGTSECQEVILLRGFKVFQGPIGRKGANPN